MQNRRTSRCLQSDYAIHLQQNTDVSQTSRGRAKVESKYVLSVRPRHAAAKDRRSCNKITSIKEKKCPHEEELKDLVHRWKAGQRVNSLLQP